MKGYKGFEKGLICRGKQYAENTVFEEETADICKSGMHFCENPFDVLSHYGYVNDKAELNEFAEVEALDECKTDDGEKYCTKKLKIGAKIGIAGLVNAFVEFTLKKVNKTSAATNTGENGFAIATGIESKARDALGCYIAVAEWVYNESTSEYELKNFKAHKVDGKAIKPDTFYCLKNGKFVEC